MNRIYTRTFDPYDIYDELKLVESWDEELTADIRAITHTTRPM